MKGKATAILVGALTLAFAVSVLSHSSAYAIFVEVTVGIDWASLPTHDEKPAAVADFDNDGDLDIAIAHGRIVGSDIIGLRLYENDGSGQFSDITSGTGLESISGLRGVPTWADFDNDGDQDLAIRIQAGLRLFCNNLIETGSLTFSEVLVLPWKWNVPSWVDFDNDGDLDLYVGGYSGQPNAMLRNNLKEIGSVTFTDVTTSVGLLGAGDAVTDAIAWGDVDNDGDADLYLATDARSDLFFRNNLKETGVASFTEVTAGVGFDVSSTYAHSATWADYDNDGDLDLYVGYGHFTANRLYHNDLVETGSLAFREIGGDLHVQRPIDASGDGAWADFDNDGDMDLLASAVGGSGSPPWVLYLNLLQETGTSGFAEVTNAEGLPALSFVRATIFFDMDNDGDLDLLVPGSWITPIRLYRNDGPTGASLQVLLQGTNSSRDGTGARMVLSTGEQVQIRDAHRYVAEDKRQEPHRIHFGLGSAEVVDELRIHWPSSCVQTLTDIPASQIITVEESCVYEASIDIKPQSCPNPLNIDARGLLPVAILGSDSLDVMDIDPGLVALAGVPLVRYVYEDVATPVSLEDADGCDECCECTEEGPDGYLDLALKFKVQELVEALGGRDALLEQKGEELPLELTSETFDGQEVFGSDCVRIQASQGRSRGRR